MAARHVMRSAVRTASLFVTLVTPWLGASCSDSGDLLTPDDGALRGELAVYISDTLEGRSETTYYLRDRDGNEQRLLFDGVPDAADDPADDPSELAPGTRLKIFGTPTRIGTGAAMVEGLRVTSYERLADPAEQVRLSLTSGTPYPARSFAFVLLDIGGGLNTTADAVMGRLVNNADSIRNYYLYDSYQRQDIMAEVIGPISYPLSTCGDADARRVATDLRARVGSFQHYLWYFGTQNTACRWSGLASVGSPQSPQRDTWYNASTNCVVLVQEPGHNFGMQHSSSLRCGTNTFADTPNGNCTTSEYGDPFDPMGGGCRHMNAWQKAYQGWFGGCNGVTVTSSGTFNLVPIERACDGVQFLKIRSPKTRMFMRPAAGGGGATNDTLSSYYLEVRTPTDFDGMLGNRSALAPMVLVHVGGDVRARTQTGLHTFLLDMTPNTAQSSSGFSDAGLLAGQTFNDPAGGLSITVQSLSASGATIVVDYPGGTGAPTCLDNTTFEGPGPGLESCGGGSGGMSGRGGGGGNGGGGSGGRGGGGGNGGTSGRGGAGGTGGLGGSAGGGTTGRGGTGGSTGGRGGAGGSAGAGGGAAGSAGYAGRGGAAGSGTGDAGTSGQAGAGAAGTTGSAGTSGAAGATGVAGTYEPGGTTGTTGAAGTTGEGGNTGGAGGRRGPLPLVGGCSCETAAGGPSPVGLTIGLALLGLVRARRRRA